MNFVETALCMVLIGALGAFTTILWVYAWGTFEDTKLGHRLIEWLDKRKEE